MNVVLHLTRRLQDALSTSNPEQTLERLILQPFSLSPWVAWTLIGLVRHRSRQRWVTDIVRSRLSGSIHELSISGALAHPEEVAQHGVVPGEIEWEYCFHGRGCCLTHRVTGESIDVDFYDEIGDYFDDWFYIHYLRSLKEPDYPEKRLLELHPSIETLILAFEELKELQALEVLPESKVFCLTRACEPLCELVTRNDAPFNTQGSTSLLTAAIGDWLQLESLFAAQSNSAIRIVRERAEHCRQLRIENLQQLFHDDQCSSLALAGLKEINAPQLSEMMKLVLQGKPCPSMIKVLDDLLSSGDSTWCDDVYKLWQRLDPSTDLPVPPAWRRAAEFLLRSGYRCEEVCANLNKVHEREVADVAILALEFAPQLARKFFYQALRSTIPIERTLAAAALAVLDEPWAVVELVRALQNTADREGSSSIRAALVCSSDRRAHEAVLAWEQQHPYTKSEGPFYTWEDVAEHNGDAWLQHEMAQLHSRVLPLRGRVT